MNIHKFNVKPKSISTKKYPAKKINSNTWEIFAQDNIELQPKEVKQITLGLGFMMSEGVVLVSLANSLRGEIV